MEETEECRQRCPKTAGVRGWDTPAVRPSVRGVSIEKWPHRPHGRRFHTPSSSRDLCLVQPRIPAGAQHSPTCHLPAVGSPEPASAGPQRADTEHSEPSSRFLLNVRVPIFTSRPLRSLWRPRPLSLCRALRLPDRGSAPARGAAAGPQHGGHLRVRVGHPRRRAPRERSAEKPRPLHPGLLPQPVRTGAQPQTRRRGDKRAGSRQGSGEAGGMLRTEPKQGRVLKKTFIPSPKGVSK